MHHITMITGDAPANVEFYADRPGEELRLPSQHEHLRPQLERVLTPLANPRPGARG